MDDLLKCWTPHRDALLKAIERTHGTHNEDDVLAMILGEKLTLITSEKSAIVVEVNSYPRLNALNIFLGAGDLSDIKDHEPMLKDLARKRNCSRITFGGRDGWRSVFGDAFGYSYGGSIIYKDLT